MALYNNIFFNTGFLCGINSWFTPSLPFYNPFQYWNVFNWGNLFSGWNVLDNYSYRALELPFFSQSDTLPSMNLNNFKLDNSVWSNYSFDVSKFNTFNNLDRFDYSNSKPKTDNEKTSVKPSEAKKQPVTSYGSTRSSNTKNKYSSSVSGKIDHTYANMNRSAALERAKKDSNLEDLSTKQNSGWMLKKTFATDIPFAKKGTAKILQKAYELTGIELQISSALGTNGNGSGSPHVKNNGYASHHNAENPKLDISYSSIAGKGITAEQFASKLWGTGLFSWILVEGDHLDVQIHPDAYKRYA